MSWCTRSGALHRTRPCASRGSSGWTPTSGSTFSATGIFGESCGPPAAPGSLRQSAPWHARRRSRPEGRPRSGRSENDEGIAASPADTHADPRKRIERFTAISHYERTLLLGANPEALENIARHPSVCRARVYERLKVVKRPASQVL